MRHRRIVNAFTEQRTHQRPLTDLGAALREEDSAPFNRSEQRYLDPAKANEPKNGGRWAWTMRDLVYNPLM
ncbi:MAG: hypothetical protein BJ554DRAFT_4710 [Olpidium bornovanus]|uniref:Uncharacterized protein n=1 Tax=Olpidium bornovanus TaxID=278681 RepID=A0A8H7ZME1_9FUNG|nr:MAG: hypothetical protein BJ554DRAFT_4710 [Olpidium bornovanus]